jgi:excisionase family DNA binding protein
MFMEDLLEGFMITKEAEARSGVDESHIRRLLRDGKLVGRKVGRDWVVNVAALDEYMAEKGWHKARWRKRRMRE